MNYLSAENLSKSYGDRYLFQNLNFGISKGDKTAIVGTNGTGKSTLLQILVGKVPAETGGVVSIRKGITLGFLSQNPDFNENLNVLDTLFDGDSPVLKAIKKYEHAMHTGDNDKLADALADMEEHQAWDYESRVVQILGKLGIHNLEQNIAQLSGGQRKRVAMAQILIQEPDFMILDEPTNHLDLDTIEWLEQLLSTSNSTLLVVTHDRYFLDKVCNHIVELDFGKAFTYKGNYAYFLEKKDERLQIEASEMEKAKNTYSRELEWMRRQPQARGTKAQYRIDAFQELDAKVNAQKDTSEFKLNVKMTRQGSKILEMSYLNKKFDNLPIATDFNYVFKRGDRIGVVGKNGVGKSTFLNMIMGLEKPDSGKIDVGETTTFGYYTQSDFTFREDQRVIDIINDIADVVTVGTGETISASAFLTHFKFEPRVQYNLVSKLSGGEKRRLQLMTILIKNPNFLILDEPTNDLDITTLNILEEFLLKFGGCLLLVSHDRYFMDRLVDHLFVFEGDGIISNFPGNYTDYREQLSTKPTKGGAKPSKTVEVSSPKESPQPTATPTSSKKRSFKEQKEYETLGEELKKIEAEKAQITEKLNSGSDNFEELITLAKRIEELNSQQDEKEMRWLELDEM
jgi:ABC transport system ATP-binding/permease protein